MNSYEILAPVGGKEQLTAAVRCGADAVYLGAKGFNARRNAENFENESLKDTVAFCHAHGVKVHVTVNTLVADSELSALAETADEVAAAGADAVIVQDLAVMKLFKNRYPSLQIHASTQCAVHNTDGVRFFEDYGVSRVVLARELSLKEIEKIRAATNVELEAFVHGALCMCVSGACYLSSVIGGRSGNRGLCAQPCRLDFKCGGNNYALSLKDMSHISHIQALHDAGVTSFKIEGRMKRPEYVAASVTACRDAIAGRDYDTDTLRAVFSRGGFTDGYLTAKRDANMFGYRGREDVVAADKVFAQLQKLYDKPKPVVPVNMTLNVTSESSILTISGLGKEVTVTGNGAIKAEKHPTDEDYAAKFLGKCGGTQFYLKGLSVKNEDGLMLPPSAMNALRRDALETLNSKLSETVPHKRCDFEFTTSDYTPPKSAELWARFENICQICFEDTLSRLILPIEELERYPELIEKFGTRLTAELPPILFPEDEDGITETTEKLKRLGLKSIWAENAFGIRLGKTLNMDIYGGANLNILNSESLEEYAKMGLKAACVSFELSMNKISHLGGSIPRGYIAYGYLPVMRVRNCPARAANGCAGCDGNPALKDRTGVEFPMICRGKKHTVILNSVPLHIGGKPQVPADFKLLYFTVEDKRECERIVSDIAFDRESTDARTGGLYYRTLK